MPTNQETTLNARPDHLPDFRNPPLNEVVLGVQFSPPKGYQQIRAGEVWSLFKSEYPLVQEQPALEPMFETFGLPHQGQIAGRLSFISGAMHDRFWFLKSSQDELIQFQRDRMLHNWRKVGDQTNEYPRFEGMAQRFTDELRRLEAYVATLTPQTLAINQCEVSYVNHINLGSDPLKMQDWLRGMVPPNVAFEDVSGAFREVIRDDSGKPIGRITYEIGTTVKPDGARIFVLNLTARGAPGRNDIDSALRFIAKGRELIVSRFASITTDAAHRVWGRQQ